MADEEMGTSADAEVPNQEQEIGEDAAAELEPVAEGSVAEPGAEEPVAEAEVAEVAEEPVAEEPAAEEPVAEEPVAAEAETAEEPGAEAPAAEAELAEVAEEHVADEPAADAISASGSAKRKRKRLPRAQRPQRTRPKREKPKERKAITRLPKPEHARGRRQERQGTVVTAAADKTIVVRVDVVKVHPMYKKVIRRSTKLHAHDESNEAKVGDIVRIVETRPLSRLKRWRLQEIVEAAK